MAGRQKRRFLFTPAGKKSWDRAKHYSRLHFPNETRQYFNDIVDVIESLAGRPHSYTYRDDLAANTGLKIYGVRAHYLIFSILPDDRIAIVAFEKKERDIFAILSRRSSEIRRELSHMW